MKTNLVTIAVLLSSSLFSTASFADVDNGKTLHNESCISCHMGGGDHTALYKSKDRKVKTIGRLQGMVSLCTQNLNIEWFPDEEKDVIEYLNKQYYHFN